MKAQFEQSREVIHSPSEPGIPAHLEEFRKKIIAENPLSPEQIRFLGEVNFDLLKKIYADIASRCGITSDKFNFIDRGNIVRGYHVSQYDPETNLVFIQDPNQRIEDGGRSNETYDQSVLHEYGAIGYRQLHTLIHEEGHSVSRNVAVVADVIFPPRDPFSGEEEDKKDRKITLPIFIQSGCMVSYREAFYQGKHSVDNATNYIKDGKPIKKYNGMSALNEGITEKLSREVMLRYLDELGTDSADVQRIKDTFQKNKAESLSYAHEVNMIERIIDKLASKNGQTKKVAWEAFVHAYFSGETFEEEDIGQLFSETFGPEFLKDLSKYWGGFMDKQSPSIHSFYSKYGL